MFLTNRTYVFRDISQLRRPGKPKRDIRNSKMLHGYIAVSNINTLPEVIKRQVTPQESAPHDSWS